MFYPFMMPNVTEQPRRNILSEVEDNIKAMEAIKKVLSEDKDKKKPDDKGKYNPSDIITKTFFFTAITPVITLGWVWMLLTMSVDVLEKIARIKGLH